MGKKKGTSYAATMGDIVPSVEGVVDPIAAAIADIETADATKSYVRDKDEQNAAFDDVSEAVDAVPSPVNTVAKKVKEPKVKATKEPKVKEPRKIKQYSIKQGVAGKSAVNQFAFITAGIDSMVTEGKTEATRDEIINKAYEFGMTKSNMTNSVLFAWYRPQLVSAGWIVVDAAEPVAEDVI